MQTQLYRHFDAAGRLLYVGISLNSVMRLSQHKLHSQWFAQIAHVEVETFPNRAAALQAERRAIAVEKPQHNIAGRTWGAGEPELTVDTPRLARAALIARVVRLVYTRDEAARELHLSSQAIRVLIETGQLGTITQGKRTFITGWQVLEYLEARMEEAARARDRTRENRLRCIHEEIDAEEGAAA